MSEDGGQSVLSEAAAGTPQPYRRVTALAAGSSLTIEHYTADACFRGGSVASTREVVQTAGLLNPAPRRVYQSERTGQFGYLLPGLEPQALFLIRLHFAEIARETPGKRIFHVSVNRVPVLTDFDIFAIAGGKNKAVIREMIAQSSPEGRIEIAFTPAVGEAKVSAIEILQVSSAVATYRFADTTGNSQPIEGVHSGIDFGRGGWLSRPGWSNVGREACVADAAKTSAGFVLPDGATLTGIALNSGSHGTYQINDGVHPPIRGRLDPTEPVRVRTNWTKPGPRITLHVSNGWEAAVTDIEWVRFER
jgi:hypothetical protein